MIFFFETMKKKIKNLSIFFRLHGSYEALKYGTSLDGLSDLTGGIAESILLKSSFTTILTTLNNLLKMTSIVMCKWDKDSDKDAGGDSSTNQTVTTVTYIFIIKIKVNR